MQEQHQKNQKIIVIKAKDADCRLDKFLTKELPAISRSKIKKLINEGAILINNSQVKPHYFLKVGDEVVIKPAAEAAPIAEPHTKAAAAEIPEPKIIFEDENFLVVNKPKGLLVHATDKGETNTLVDWLIKNRPELSDVGEDRYRAGIIHRLDRDVTGVMLVAKTKAAFEHLKKQFKDRKIKKEYLALVYGRMEDQSGEINLPIGRSKEGKVVAHPRVGDEKFQEDDRTAKTRYWVLNYLKNYTLLKVQILTGRPHQIRVHLSAVGHPIIGDPLYKPKKNFLHFFSKKVKVIQSDWFFLHSQRIGFTDLTEQWREYEAPIPPPFNNFVNKLKNE